MVLFLIMGISFRGWKKDYLSLYILLNNYLYIQELEYKPIAILHRFFPNWRCCVELIRFSLEWLENLIFIWVLYFSLIGLPYPIQGMKSVESKLSHRLYFPVNWCFSKCGDKKNSWFVMSGHNSYPQTQTLSFLDLICLCIGILIM